MTFVLGGLNRTGYTSYGKVDALIRQLELSMHDNVAYDVCNDETDKAFEKMEQSVRAVREFIDALSAQSSTYYLTMDAAPFAFCDAIAELLIAAREEGVIQELISFFKAAHPTKGRIWKIGFRKHVLAAVSQVKEELKYGDNEFVAMFCQQEAAMRQVVRNVAIVNMLSTFAGALFVLIGLLGTSLYGRVLYILIKKHSACEVYRLMVHIGVVDAARNKLQQGAKMTTSVIYMYAVLSFLLTVSPWCDYEVYPGKFAPSFNTTQPACGALRITTDVQMIGSFTGTFLVYAYIVRHIYYTGNVVGAVGIDRNKPKSVDDKNTSSP
ncbi:hypothetical protein QR680_004307 [Steinernema hermaphroditum]|uniref:Uncharacterized protein n=1 Tax=Steinernema hermaphroditum TaxID=289476 RepID=A0AA39HN99_9BILA|nr:hypothetical protein QR680_004307 [Steinernema hermaphroditum]